MTHLPHFFFAASIEWVLAEFYQFLEKNIPDLREASAGGFHQSL